MLAYHGGKKTRTKTFEPQEGPRLNSDYLNACAGVLRSEILSGYRGNATGAFWGGNEVQSFEKKMSNMFDVEHAIACNSATSGLWMACAAINLQPGDEVIVAPWSMSCSATVPLLFGAIPVFADIHEKFYSLDPADVERKITSNTKAIIAVDLFGLPYLREIDEIAKRHGIFVIEDAAQAIGAKRDGRYAGTLGDIGVFSFTQGKHMTAGEGGACVTNDERLATNLALARNHAEAVTSDAERSGDRALCNDAMVGLNLRMTEMQAAIMSIELDRLEDRIKNRMSAASSIIDAIAFAGVDFYPNDLFPDDKYEHALYCLPLAFGEEYNTKQIVEAIKAELVGDRVRLDRGVPIASGYLDPLYKMPLFREKKHWAFKIVDNFGLGQDYGNLYLPNAESLQKNGFINTLLHALDLKTEDIDDICRAFTKVIVAVPKRDVI
jgi:dTDP-4-amino-4,6-dideoxygalactose transaminase